VCVHSFGACICLCVCCKHLGVLVAAWLALKIFKVLFTPFLALILFRRLPYAHTVLGWRAWVSKRWVLEEWG